MEIAIKLAALFTIMLLLFKMKALLDKIKVQNSYIKSLEKRDKTKILGEQKYKDNHELDERLYAFCEGKFYKVFNVNSKGEAYIRNKDLKTGKRENKICELYLKVKGIDAYVDLETVKTYIINNLYTNKYKSFEDIKKGTLN
jgi:hypothetical protein